MNFFFYTFIKCGVQYCVLIVYLYFPVTDEDTVKRYYAKFEEKFFQTCEKELAKINTFYSGNDCDEGPFTAFSCEKSKILSRLGCDCTEEGANVVFITFVLLSPEKLAEAQRRFATLQNELQSSLDAQRESWANGRGLRKRRTVFALSQQERCKHRNIKDLQLAFSEFYLSLILLQNYQVTEYQWAEYLHFGPGFQYSVQYSPLCLCRTWISQVSGRFWRSMIRFWKPRRGLTGGWCMLKWLHFIPAKRSHSSYLRPRYMHHTLVLIWCGSSWSLMIKTGQITSLRQTALCFRHWSPLSWKVVTDNGPWKGSEFLHSELHRLHTQIHTLTFLRY